MAFGMVLRPFLKDVCMPKYWVLETVKERNYERPE
jgi:hypothetical protein